MAVRTRIAFLGGDGGVSGVPRHIKQLCDLLGGRMDITVFSDVNTGGYDFATVPHLKHVVVPGLSSSLNPRRIAKASSAFQTAITDAGPFDIIWAHARLTLPFSRRYLNKTDDDRTRLIVTYHGSPLTGRTRAIAATTRQVEKNQLVTAPPHDLVFLSQTDRDSFDGLPLHRHQLHIIPNCSDLGDLPPPNPPAHPTVIMTTRASRQKNLTAAARIFAALPPDHRLILLGMGTDTKAKALFHKIIGPEASARVTFVGPVADVRPYLVAADCYLLTSHYEGLSIGALEAFEAGLPVVMPNIGGAADIARVHRQFREIDTSNPATSARVIQDTIAIFRADRSAHISTNHAAWSSAFHRDVWAGRITDLLANDPRLARLR